MTRRILLSGLILATLWAIASSGTLAQEEGYVGSDKCAQCHGAKYESYRQTWHARILRPATEDTVVGDFGSADPDLTFQRDDVLWVVGGQFSQRYLTEIEGELYVLPAQWNVGSAQWIAYHPDDWQQRPYATYCAGCHSTGYDSSRGAWVEPGVQCEACHGPGREHVALAGDRAHIVNPAALRFDEQTEICGQCHLRGHDPTGEYAFPTGYQPGGSLALDETFITTSDPEAFWPDGSSRLHHQEYLDWKLGTHAEAVACTFCHVSHSRGETEHQTRFVGNHRCVICHEEKKDVALHISYHPLGDMVCTDCHMPTLAPRASAEYNFDLHSHTFWAPNPLVTIQFGGQEQMPNACNLCHADESPEWAAEALGLELGAVILPSTPTAPMPPTPVPSPTPFLEMTEEELAGEQEQGANLLLWSAVGLALLVVAVALILGIQRLDRGDRRNR